MATRRYQDIVNLLKKWPIEMMTGKDNLGTFYRTLAREVGYGKIVFEGNEKEQNEQYMSLKRLTENYWNDRYPVTKQLTASGFGPDRCRKYLEDEFTKISLNGEKPE